jgi:hypothetical protein
LRPDKTSSLKFLYEQTKAIAVKPQKLNHVAPASAKNKDVTGKWLLLEHCLHLRT